MPKLTDTQLVILNAAAGRDDRRALPLPASLKLAKGPAASVLAGLVKRGLLVPCTVTGDDEVWREDGDTRLTLAISDDGLDALGVAHEAPAPSPRKKNREAEQKTETITTDTEAAATPRPGSKLETVVNLLRRPDGATVAEIMAATRWQAHSVRGAISGALRKKLGLTVITESEDERGRVYRIVTPSSETRS